MSDSMLDRRSPHRSRCIKVARAHRGVLPQYIRQGGLKQCLLDTLPFEIEASISGNVPVRPVLEPARLLATSRGIPAAFRKASA